MKYIIILVVIFTAHIRSSASNPVYDGLHYTIKITQNKKVEYNIGDTVKFKITATQQTRNCEEGIAKTKIFTKGITILSQSEWEHISTYSYEKTVTVVILGNRNNKVMLTAFRQTDKGIINESYLLPMKE